MNYLIALQPQLSSSALRPQRPFGCSNRRSPPLAPAHFSTTPGQPHNRNTPSAVSRAAEPHDAAQQDTATSQRRQPEPSAREHQPIALVSRRRMLHTGMMAAVGGMCACCPGGAQADAWTYGALRTMLGSPVWAPALKSL